MNGIPQEFFDKIIDAKMQSRRQMARVAGFALTFAIDTTRGSPAGWTLVSNKTFMKVKSALGKVADEEVEPTSKEDDAILQGLGIADDLGELEDFFTNKADAMPSWVVDYVDMWLKKVRAPR